MAKLSSGFSWADEVEKEEQSREVQNLHKRPNPFGSARPREVVLEEKGIDWRKFDQLHPQSTHPRKEKKLKENIPAAAPERIELLPPSFKVLDASNIKPRNLHCVSVFPDQPMENLSPLVPPLMYPPRNYLDLVKGVQSACETSSRNVNSTENRIAQVQFQEANMRNNGDHAGKGRTTRSKSKPRNLEHGAPCDGKEMGSVESECREGWIRGVNVDRRRDFDSRIGKSREGAVDVRVGFSSELHGREGKRNHYNRAAGSGETLVVRGAAEYGCFMGRETCVGRVVHTSNVAESYQRPHRETKKIGRKDNSIRGRYR